VNGVETDETKTNDSPRLSDAMTPVVYTFLPYVSPTDFVARHVLIIHITRLQSDICTSAKNAVTSHPAGTIFHKTRTDFRKWFWALYLVAHDKRGCSAVTLQRELGVTYKTAWLMLPKIRQTMQDRDQHYVLSGVVELDETYFGGPGEGGKHGLERRKRPFSSA